MIDTFKEVLTFADGCLAKVDGIFRASVIATHAIGAMTVPLGTVILHCDILQRAVFGTDATAYACVRYRELAVGYEQTVEEGLEDI